MYQFSDSKEKIIADLDGLQVEATKDDFYISCSGYYSIKQVVLLKEFIQKIYYSE
jgi:hypothetical protein